MGRYKYLKDGTKMTWPRCQYHQRRWLAVMLWREVEPNATDKEIECIITAYRENKPRSVTGYVAYTDLKKWTRLAYPRIFAVVKTLHTNDPYSVTVSVNRMGENVYVRFNQ